MVYFLIMGISAAAVAAADQPEAAGLFETMPSNPDDFPWPFVDLVDPRLERGKPPPPPPPPVIAFADSFGDHMVLQQSPAVAAVYGTLPNTTGIAGAAAAVLVKVTGSGESYTVTATTDAAMLSWKALLKPTAAGGSYMITVTMGASYAANITDATFGDVW